MRHQNKTGETGLSTREISAAIRLIFRPYSSQRGMALVLALGMLVIMSLLGTMALNTANTEAGLSGNYQSTQTAFFAAQRAVEYAISNPDIYALIGKGSIDLELSPHPRNIKANSEAGFGLLQIQGDPDEGPEDNKVSYLFEGALPQGCGSDPTYFSASYYLVSLTGAGPGKAATRVETQIARISPR